ncbi:hypothetical protein ACFUTR_23360 [Streptomyces sp. NPDC057367]|uniref:hypothetical protein n=1 Tax=Streptomyces sp. NPDC057367 TaxID=3346108 RepID=UPI00363330BB
MSEFADATLSRYLDHQPALRDALRSDPVQAAQIEALRQTLTAMERALADEGVPQETQRRVINRMVWGDPEGIDDVYAQMLRVRKQMLAADLPPDLARAWWELPSTSPARPDEEPRR